MTVTQVCGLSIVAFRGERGSYNAQVSGAKVLQIVAFRGERGSYNPAWLG